MSWTDRVEELNKGEFERNESGTNRRLSMIASTAEPQSMRKLSIGENEREKENAQRYDRKNNKRKKDE